MEGWWLGGGKVGWYYWLDGNRKSGNEVTMLRDVEGKVVGYPIILQNYAHGFIHANGGWPWDFFHPHW